ncbi:MAG: hypothetical protein HY698_17495 [Deltaproteobacteria bacterium]|nr:hypothetical protein [Deltaproteobacteria bacterium]
MVLPRWVPLLVGLLLFAFGIYRIRLFARGKKQEREPGARPPRTGMGIYGLRGTHLAFGIAYILAGIFLTMHAFGLRLFPNR